MLQDLKRISLVNPHAINHHYPNGADPLSAEEIGAEPLGAAEAAIISHVGEEDPHSQYTRNDAFIDWNRLINAPSGANPPPLIFSPMETPGGEIIVITGALPQATTISDPPVGNEGLPCWQSISGIQSWRSVAYIVDITKTYRATAFMRKISTPNASGRFSLVAIRASDGVPVTLATQLNPLNDLGPWTQYDISSSVNSSIYSEVYWNALGGNSNTFQLYAPQLSVVV